jgi:PAS domain S-box-containing protein
MAKAQILVVEDDNIVAMELRDRLQSLGYAVPAVASYGEGAVEKAGETHPDLVLMDIKLKGDMDGTKAAEAIRARFDIPVVYLTAYADESTLQRAKITEPYGYILKPFEERKLHSTIEMALYKHKVERRLKESEQWLATTLRSIGDAVMATDKRGLITFMNPVAEALTGWRQESALGKDLAEVFRIMDEETRTVVESPVTRVLREDVIVGLANHSILIAKDGTETPIDDSAAPIRDDRGNITGVVLVFRDIVERRQVEEALARNNRELAILNAVVAVVSRSLRLEEVAEQAVHLIHQHLGYTNVALLLVDEKTDELYVKAACGYPQVVQGLRLKIGQEGITGWVAAYREPLLIPDVRQDPRYVMGAEEILSELAVPVVLGEELLGVLDVESDKVAAFGEDDLKTLITLAGQIAVAIRNAQLFEAVQKRAAQLAVVNRVARQTASVLDPDQLLREIVAAIQQGFDYYNVALFLLDEAAGELKMPAIAGGFADVAAPDYCQAVGAGVIGWAAETGQPLLANDVSQEPRYILGFLEEPLTKAELCVPLKLAGQVIGVLDVQDTQLNVFDETDLLAMETLADQIAVAIENARLFGETKRRFEETTALYQISLDITAQLEMTELLKSLVERAVTLLRAETGNIYLYDSERKELRLVIGSGYTGKYVGTALKPGEGMAGKVFQTGEPLIVSDYRTWEGRALVYEADQPFTAVLGVPLKWRERIIGVLAINADVQKRTFNQDDVWLATLFANQAAIAIENARLYEEDRRRLQELRMLVETSASLSSTLETDEILKSVTEQMAKAVDAYGCVISDWDEQKGVMRTIAEFNRARWLRGEGATYDLEDYPATARALHTGQPQAIRVSDPAAGENERALLQEWEMKSLLLLPLQAKGTVIGVVELYDAVAERQFTDDEIALCQGLAAQAAIAIENARLYEVEAQRRREAETLRQAAMALTSTLDLEEVLNHILEQLHRMVAYDSSSVHLLRGDHLEIVGGRGFVDLSAIIGLRFPFPGDNPNTRVIESGEPVILADAQAAHAPFRQPPHDHIRSWLGVPMRFREQIIGLITLDSTELGYFTTDQARLAAAFANQAAVAIENARLYEQVADIAAELEVRVRERTEELTRRTKEISFLYQAGVALSSSLDKDEVLNILAQQAVLAVHAVDCTIYELQDDALVLVAGHSDPALTWKESEIRRRYFLDDYPATREAVEKGQPLWVRVGDPLADKAERAELQRLGYTASLQVHIVSRDQVLGVLEVFDNKPERGFSEGDAALLQTIANQASMAIEKAHLFQQVREERNHLELLYEVSRKLSASLDLEQTLYDIFEVSVAATGAGRGSVFVFDDEGQVSHRILTRDLSPAEVNGSTDQVLREGLASWVLERKQPAIVFDTRRDERWLTFPGDSEPAGSAMTIPFIERGQVRGLLTLVHPQPYHFNQVHLDLLLSIANQVTIVIERARLYQETRRRAMEVAAQKEQTDAIVRSMADGLIVTDLENRLVLVNPAAEELLKLQLKDAIGQEIGANIRDDRLRQIMRDTLAKQQAGYEVDIELTELHAGAQRIMRAHTAVVNDPAGQPMGIVTTLRDVTHEREVQQLKDELVSTVSHELRTPMASVLGFSELLLTRQLSEEKQQLYIRTIQKEAQRLSALINDFLDIQRMERGKQEYHFEEMDLGELVREVVVTYSGQSEAHTLTLDLPPELPPVLADSERLKQVLGNLLSNAIKFSPGGGIVTVSARVWGDSVRVAVSDEGIGIPTEALPHIFDKFFRVDSSDIREIRGTGLGLAICKEIVEAHGGDIWTESQEGIGTTVTFSLSMMARKRILAIDDEDDIRRMFQRLLSESYEVFTAADGQEGLWLVGEELPDLVILDIAMPVMNGYQFLEKVKGDERTKDIPVIAISGVDTDIDRLKELGADEFLSKPFSSTVLSDTIQRLLEKS